MNKADCKSILDYKEFPNYDILYCDPPWEERMTKWFRTKMRKDIGKAPSFTFEEIITKLGESALKNKPLYIEYDIKTYEGVINRMESMGHKFAGVTIYPLYTKSQQAVLSFNTNIVPESNVKKISHSITEMFRKHGEGLTIFDPFAGIGITAKMVIASGNYYHGSELNPKRVAKLKTILNLN